MLSKARGKRFQLILIKPSHYDAAGYVVQWLRSTMPSNSLAAVYSLARGAAERQVLGPDLPIDVIAMDETNTRVRPRDIAKRIAKNGGLGLCRELKNEIYECPPILVLTGRPQDGWLAAWSMADDAVPHPLDPIRVAEAIAGLARKRAAAL